EAREQARRRFDEQEAGGPVALAVVWDGDEPVATGRVAFTQWGLYLTGVDRFLRPAVGARSARSFLQPVRRPCAGEGRRSSRKRNPRRDRACGRWWSK